MDVKEQRLNNEINKNKADLYYRIKAHLTTEE
jgi:hypothetical protein